MPTRTVILEERDMIDAIAERARTYLSEVDGLWAAHVKVRNRKGATVIFTQPEPIHGQPDVGVGGTDVGGTGGDSGGGTEPS